jgi:N-acetylglucosamine transport system substrate-binding protein
MTLSPETPATGESGKSDLSRRTVLRRAAAVGVLAIPAVGILDACASGSDSTKTNTGGGNVSDTNPLGIDPNLPVEVVIFNGGYGDKYATDVHVPLYQKAWPNSKVTESKAEEISTTLQPRFAGGNPPDVIDNSGSKLMDNGALVSAGQLQDLTPLLNAKSVDNPAKTVKDTLVDGTVDSGLYQGKPYALNYVYTVYGIWYNAKLFASKGWKPASTWSDFTALLDQIKAAGITPYGYAGANASYYQYLVILSSAAKLGGADILKNIDNLEDGAWTVDAVKQAATAWAEIGAKYTDKSFLGLRHTEVQLKQDNDQVAFYPSGNWLENEQKANTPATFEYAMMPVPSLTSSDKLDATALFATAGEGFIVAAQGKNPKGGMEYLRQMLSVAGAKGFTQQTGSLTSVQGASEGLTLPPGLQSSSKALAAAKNTFNYRFDGWYGALDTELRAATNELFYQGGTADKFCTRMQAKADAIKKDPSITKQTR